MRLDQLDVKIVSLLLEDARLSFREIAERLGSTTPTVSARVKALEDVGLVRGYRVQLDHSILGGASYVLTVTVQPPTAHAALAAIRSMPGIHTAHLLAGGRIVAHIHLRPPSYALSHLHKALADLPGILTYDANEVIESHEQTTTEDLPENVEVPCHQCHGHIHGDPVKAKLGDRAHVFCCRQCLADFRAKYESLEAAGKATSSAPPRRPR